MLDRMSDFAGVQLAGTVLHKFATAQDRATQIISGTPQERAQLLMAAECRCSGMDHYLSIDSVRMLIFTKRRSLMRALLMRHNLSTNPHLAWRKGGKGCAGKASVCIDRYTD